MSRFFNPSQVPIGTNTTPRSQETTHIAPVRDLTAGEIAMCKLIFKESIDYKKAKIHNEALFEKQTVPMTPRGEIYYLPEDYYPDYSSPSPLNKKDVEIRVKNTFIHEMAHIWQYQHGMNVVVRGAAVHACHILEVCRDPYLYTLEEGKDLLKYGLEQQAQIIADYFCLKHLKNLKGIFGIMVRDNEMIKANFKVKATESTYTKPVQDSQMRQEPLYSNLIKNYESVLRKFIQDPNTYKW
jgi:hypothetical protein